MSLLIRLDQVFCRNHESVGAVVTIAALAFSGPVGLIALGFRIGQLVVKFSDDVTSATLTDSTNLLQTSRVLTVSRDPDGQHVIDLGIRLKNPPTDKPLTINHLTLKLRLDVLGDGTSAQQGADGSIVVPRMKGIAATLSVPVLLARRRQGEPRHSHTLTHLS